MFDDYAKKLKELSADVPKIFETTAKKGAIHFENTAKEITDKERLVDTGAYRRNWNGEFFKPDEKSYGIACQNTMEYASHLEYGHKLRGINENRKTPAKHPDHIDAANVFYRGFFVGKRAITNTEQYIINELENEIKKANNAR